MKKEEKRFSFLDQEFTYFLARYTHLTGKEKDRFEETVKELSQQLTDGHSCILIDHKTQAIMLASGVVSEKDKTPLILEDNRLYFHRYWHYENRLANQLKDLSTRQYHYPKLESGLCRYFPSTDGNEADFQKKAARTALTQRFCIITGGPGTGKTTTIVKIVALLLEFSGKSLHIALAAPTGKAAMRLQESISHSKSTLPCSDEIRNRIPETVTTLHHLLGARPPSPYFYHHADNPLPHDLVVIDEASMVDLALMSKLVDALRKNARLILLGDSNQLASVESGAILSDLTVALPRHTLTLDKSHRFDENIKELAEAVNQQQSERAWEIVHSVTEYSNVVLLKEDPIDYIAQKQRLYLELIESNAEFSEISQAFHRFQGLTSNRQGKNGVENLNKKVEQRLSELGLIDRSGFWYLGRPIMVTQNDPNSHLYNGDVGICMFDSPQSDRLMLFFQRSDGSVKKILPARLPHCETIFVMTIHKSQGSEFDEVLVVMPEQLNPVLTKELLYTAITRARKMVKLVTSRAIFAEAIQQNVLRHSGLVDKLKSRIIRPRI